MSDSSPTRAHEQRATTRPRKGSVPRGFLAPLKPKRRPIGEMSVRELQDLYDRNAKILSSPAPSTSTYVDRVSTEQAAIEARLVELVGMEAIRRGLAGTRIGDITEEDDTHPDRQVGGPPLPHAISAKQRALARWAPQPSNSAGSGLTLQEAIKIEREVHEQDLKRQQEQLEKKKRLGLPIKGEILSREEQEARIRTFMNYKPSESDLEDDSDEDEQDPARWFEDDQDDGRKGQDIIEPDYEDMSEIIRVDETRLPGVFYEPRDEGE